MPGDTGRHILKRGGLVTPLGRFILTQMKQHPERLTIRRLGELSGVDHGYISRIIRGKKTRPSAEVLAKLAPHLGVSSQVLFYLAGYVEQPDSPPEDATTRVLRHRPELTALVRHAATMPTTKVLALLDLLGAERPMPSPPDDDQAATAESSNTSSVRIRAG